MSVEWVTIEVIKWDEYNPRSDRKKHSWFRLESGIAAEPKFFGLTAAQKFIAVCIFAEVCKAQGKPTRVSIPWLARQLEVKTSDVLKTIQQLEATGVVRLPTGSQAVSTGDLRTYVRTNERTDNTNEQSALARVSFDLESLYRKYPRKEGKTPGMKKAAKEILSQADFDALSSAIDRYSKHCRANGTEPKFVKHFSTFMSSWRDWLDPQAGKAILVEPASEANRSSVFKEPVDDVPFAPPPEDFRKRWSKDKKPPTETTHPEGGPGE